MKPALVADEMFPEGAGPYTEEEVRFLFSIVFFFGFSKEQFFFVNL